MNTRKNLLIMVALPIWLSALVAPRSIQAISGTDVVVVGTVMASAAAAARALYNFMELRALQMHGRSEHVLLGDKRIRLSLWGREQWPSARLIAEKRDEVLVHLAADVVAGKVKIFEDPIQINPTWNDVQRALEREVDLLEEDMLFLEQKHLSYYGFDALWDSFGFVRDYKQACLQEGVDPYGARSWTKEQEDLIEFRVKELAQCKWWHYCRPNYGKAARIYWRSFKLVQRLKALQEIITKMKLGDTSVEAYTLQHAGPNQNINVHLIG